MPRPVQPLQMNPEDVLRLRSMIADGQAEKAARILLLRSEEIDSETLPRNLASARQR